MSVHITLYKNESPDNYVTKTLSSALAFEGTFRGECGVLYPVFSIETDTNISDYNYCYIQEFNRYYFISDMIAETDKLWRIYCSVDVLQSFSTQIKEHRAVIAKQERKWNLYLNDGDTFKVYQNPKIVQKSFPQGFSGAEFVMIVAGTDQTYAPPNQSVEEIREAMRKEMESSEER